MLPPKSSTRPMGRLRTYAYLVAAEIEDHSLTSPDTAAMKLGDALIWAEGVGKVDVELLGELTDEPTNDSTPVESITETESR